MTKQEKLTNAVKTFETSLQSTDDYLVLFQVVRNVLSQGSGLLWSDVRNCIDTAKNNNQIP